MLGGFGGGAFGGSAGLACGPAAPACSLAGGIAMSAKGAAVGAAAGAAAGLWLSQKGQGWAVGKAQGLRPRIEEHLKKLEDNPGDDAAVHWRGEIRGWLKQTQDAAKRMGKRSADEWNRYISEAMKKLDKGS